MSNEIDAIRASSGWQDYYASYQHVYRRILQARWALGRVGFANQLHHTAIPDVSGVTVGAARWAAYSQPSTPTLVAFLEVFSTLVALEPARLRTNRYLFFVPDDQLVSREDAKKALGDHGGKLDFWLGRLDEAINAKPHLSLIQSINVMFSGDRQVVDMAALRRASPFDALISAKQQVDAASLHLIPSIVPPSIRRLQALSSLLLSGARAQLETGDFLKLGEPDISIAAFIAVERGRASGWAEAELKGLVDLVTLVPPRTREYVVAPGDILTRLVREFYEQPFETLWPILKLLNPHIKDPNVIRIGDRIKFPLLDEE